MAEVEPAKEVVEATAPVEAGPEPQEAPEAAEAIEPPAAVEGPPPEPGIFDDLYDSLFGKPWEMWVGAIILSFMSIVLFLIMSPWGSSGGLQNLGMNMYDGIGLDLGTFTKFTENRYAMLSILMITGALGAALLSKEFAIRVAPAGELFKGLTGGLLMGVGAVLAIGCTIGGFFSSWPALSGAGLVFLLALMGGTFRA